MSLVISLYDEEDNVHPLCEAIREALAGWEHTYEVILVEDGSTDHTLERLREVAADEPRIRCLVLKRNSGQTLAMASGFAKARGRVVVSMDGDLQNDPRDIPLVVERLGRGFDVVCGWRKNRQDAWLSRTLPSKIANKMIAWVTGIPIHDNGCSLKAYRADVIRSLHLYSEMHRFLPALASMTGAAIDEVVVRHHPRIHGESKYGISRTFKVLGDMVSIKMVTQFSSRPGKWFGLMSLPWFVMGTVCSTVWLFHLWAFGEAPIVYMSLSVLFLFVFMNLMTFSILSEIFLANADRRYLQNLADVLTVSTGLGPKGERQVR